MRPSICQNHLITIIRIACILPTTLNASTVAEIEGNNSYSTSQLIASPVFTQEAVANIEFSTSYKHASIAATGDGTVDWFVFNHVGDRLILDIDNGMPTIDLELGIWSISGILIASNDDRGSLDPGSVHPYDSYINITNLVSGLYYVAVSAYPSSQSNGFVVGGGGFNTPGYTLNISSGVIPEPSSVVLFGLASLGLAVRRRRH
jgi:hypothetical protein